MREDVIIIGGGPAGLGAAVELYERGIRNIRILERENELGGILNQCIHNGFGLQEFKEELTGPEYAQRFIDRVNDYRIPYETNTMVTECKPDKTVIAVNERGIHHYHPRAVLFAMGCRERTSGAIAIPGTRPVGVYTAGLAQRMMNMEDYRLGTEAVIYGSGDIGLIMARRLTLEGIKVHAVVEIMKRSSGLQRNISQCLEDYEIPLLLSTKIVEIHGKDRLEGVSIQQIDQAGRPIAETKKRIDCDLLLTSVGLIPENECTLRTGIRLDDKTGGAIVNQWMETNQLGFFSCGNVLHVHDIVDFVTEESRRAAIGIENYLTQKDSNTETDPVIAGENIRYVVPQRVGGIGKVVYSFRVTRPIKSARILIMKGERIIKEVKKRALKPQEMTVIAVDLKEKLDEKGAWHIECIEQ